MSRGWREMAAELGMFLASVALLGCLALAVFDLALTDYGEASSACPAASAPAGAEGRGTAAVSVVPPGITCTWGSGADATSVYEPLRVPYALAGAVAAIVALVALRRIALRQQAPNYREPAPVYAEDLLDELDRHRGGRGATT